MREAIDLVKTAFRDLTRGRAVVPLRLALDVQPGSATTLLMPAYLPDLPALGFKAISIFQENGKRGLPIGNAMVCMIDAETGVPTALLSRSSGWWASANATAVASDVTAATPAATTATVTADRSARSGRRCCHQSSAVHSTAPTSTVVMPHAQRVR